MSRMLKELAGLSPWGWDARISTHPPGPASKRDFSEVDKLAHGGTTRRHETSSPPPAPLQKRSVTLKGKEKEKKVEETQRQTAKSVKLPAKVDDLFGSGSGDKKQFSRKRSRDLNIQVDKSAKREKLIVRIPSKGPRKASEAVKKPSSKVESGRKRKDASKGKSTETTTLERRAAPSTAEKKKSSKSDRKGVRTPNKPERKQTAETKKAAARMTQPEPKAADVAVEMVEVEEAPFVPTYVSKKHLALQQLREKELKMTDDDDDDDFIYEEDTRVNTLKVEKTFTSHEKVPYEDIMKERSETETEALNQLEESVPWHMQISGDLAGLFGSSACGFRKRYQAPKPSRSSASSAINKACSVLKALDKAHGWLWKRN